MIKRYIDFIDLNGRHNKEFKFTVRVTWDKYDDPEYVLFNIQEVIARSTWDAEQKAKYLFTNEIMGGKTEEMKYLSAYVINDLNAPVYEQL